MAGTTSRGRDPTTKRVKLQAILKKRAKLQAGSKGEKEAEATGDLGKAAEATKRLPGLPGVTSAVARPGGRLRGRFLGPEAK